MNPGQDPEYEKNLHVQAQQWLHVHLERMDSHKDLEVPPHCVSDGRAPSEKPAMTTRVSQLCGSKHQKPIVRLEVCARSYAKGFLRNKPGSGSARSPGDVSSKWEKMPPSDSQAIVSGLQPGEQYVAWLHATLCGTRSCFF